MDEKIQIENLIKKLSDLEEKVDALSKMSIFIDKNNFEGGSLLNIKIMISCSH